MNDLARLPSPAHSPQDIATLLRQGHCPPERAFDAYLPPALQAISSTFWTQLAVAVRAAAWFEELAIETVVDIGSGAGKFCVATALAGTASYIGLEQREGLVDVARALARTFAVEDRVTFRHGVFGQTETPVADAYYLYNPFGENLFVGDECLDGTVELTPGRYLRDIDSAEDLLEDLPAGTHVLTYNGFGGRFPVDYRQVYIDLTLPAVLQLWRKGDVPRAAHGDGFVPRARSRITSRMA